MSTSFLSLTIGKTLRFIKDFPIIYRLHRLRTEYRFVKREGNIKSIFATMYEKNAWNNIESVSGIGSTKAHSQVLAKSLPDFCEQHKIRTFLDAPCGDFNWMKHVTFYPELKYIGGDIVEKLVQHNMEKYANESRSFIHLDIVNDPLVKADIIFVRDCLVHLTYSDIRLFLKNLVKSDIQYLLTTSFPKTWNNYDITTGNWRAINLQRSPFKFPTPLATIHEKAPQDRYQYYDKSMNLYRVSDLQSLEFLK
jgi:hypothetical protein